MANKVVQLVDKNSNNLYPIAGSVITDAVSTTAISNQAVTNPKIENGAINGVANDATAIGTAKLALDTVGTPNLRDASVTSDKIDWTTYKYVEINTTSTYGTVNTNIPISITAEKDNDFCTVSNNVITFTKSGLYLCSLTAGRSALPGADSMIDVGATLETNYNSRVVFVSRFVKGGNTAWGMASNVAVIQAGTNYVGRIFDYTKNLGNCDIFRLRITPIL